MYIHTYISICTNLMWIQNVYIIRGKFSYDLFSNTKFLLHGSNLMNIFISLHCCIEIGFKVSQTLQFLPDPYHHVSITSFVVVHPNRWDSDCNYKLVTWWPHRDRQSRSLGCCWQRHRTDRDSSDYWLSCRRGRHYLSTNEERFTFLMSLPHVWSYLYGADIALI